MRTNAAALRDASALVAGMGARNPARRFATLHATRGMLTISSSSGRVTANTRSRASGTLAWVTVDAVQSADTAARLADESSEVELWVDGENVRITANARSVELQRR